MTCLVIGCDVGDPISCVYVHDGVSGACIIIAGTMLGKIWVYDTRNKYRVCLAGFGEDAIRGLYCDGTKIYCVVGDTVIKSWLIEELPAFSLLSKEPTLTRFTRRSSTLIKYTLQNESSMICMYGGLTSLFNIITKEYVEATYRLLHSAPNCVSACPVSFADKFVLIAECVDDAESLQFRLVDLTDSSTLARGEFGWNGSSLEIFRQIRSPKICIQHAKLFQGGKALLVAVREGSSSSRVFSFEVPNCRLIETFSAVKGSILSLEVSEPEGKFGVLSDSGEVTVWPLAGGAIELRGKLEGNFKLDLAYPFSFGSSVAAVATDNGVVLVELDKLSS